MGLKTKLVKIIEHPSSLIAGNRGLMMAKFDVLSAIRFNQGRKFETLIDVGSASGEYTHIFKEIFPLSNVYSFEPIPELHKCLKNYSPEEIALWNKNESLDFHINNDPRNSSLLKSEKNLKVKEVKGRRFDSLNIDIKKPALLKIDVEGAEKQVLEGFGKELRKFDVVLLELNMDKNNKPSKIIEIMEKNGFYKFVQKDLRSSFKQCNMFFIKEP